MDDFGSSSSKLKDLWGSCELRDGIVGMDAVEAATVAVDLECLSGVGDP